MNTFFSKTDNEVFKISNYPNFLSVIVNNAMEIIAKVGFKITTVNKPIDSFLHPVTKEKIEKERQELIEENYILRDCIIEWNKETTNEYYEQIKEIKRKKQEEKKHKQTINYNNYRYNNHH